MFVVPKRNALQRALNRAGHRFGVKPFPVAFESSLPEAGQEAAEVFEAVYRTNYWGSEESKSGSGSELARTEAYRARLITILRLFTVDTLFDAPCGDLNWMPEVLKARPAMRYIGGDVAPEAIDIARSRCPDLDIRLFDICRDPFPDADIWHCRDTLFHLSFDDTWAAMENFARSSIEWALITSHPARMLKNLDIRTGGWRLLDLRKPPFSLPKPLCWIDDTMPGEFPRKVGLWPARAIREALKR